LCGIAAPDTVEGISLVSDRRRESLYCEHYENELAMRMIRKGKYKLIYYATGNRFQLFDLEADPREMSDLSNDTAHCEIKADLTKELIANLYGSDVEWIENGTLVGLPDKEYLPAPDYGLRAQRGWRI
jgi:arylsulfatase A-like enzyme